MRRLALLPLTIAPLLAFFAGVPLAHAQLSITANQTYTIDFDHTVSGVSNGAYSGAGFSPSPQAGQLNSNAWSINWGTGSTLSFGDTQTSGLPWAAGSAVNSPVFDAGFYAFSGGNISTGTAFGIQPTFAGFVPGDVILKVQNNTGLVMTSLDFSYLLYIRNDQGRSSRFDFAFSQTGFDDSSFTTIPSMVQVSPPTADANGFVAYPKNSTISGLSVPVGGLIYLRWHSDDVGGTGLRDEFAIDNITLTNFLFVPNLNWRPSPSGDTAWNASDGDNWLNTITNSTAGFSSGSNVVFTNVGVGPVTIAPEGVSPASTIVSNTTGTYTFSGGPIGGSGSLTKSGAGILVLAAPNQYTGSTIVTGGTLKLAVAGAIYNHSKIELAGGTLNTGGFDQSFGSLKLSANSTLDLGPTAGSVHFAASSGNVWTGTLSIVDWAYGTTHWYVGDGSGAGLSAAQRSQIHFADFSSGASLASTGEIVPLVGDVDQNGTLESGDLTALEIGLTNRPAFKTARQLAAPNFNDADVRFILDVNLDGKVDNTDIQALLYLLKTQASGSDNIVPEPPSLIIFITGAVALVAFWWRREIRRSSQSPARA